MAASTHITEDQTCSKHLPKNTEKTCEYLPRDLPIYSSPAHRVLLFSQLHAQTRQSWFLFLHDTASKKEFVSVCIYIQTHTKVHLQKICEILSQFMTLIRITSKLPIILEVCSVKNAHLTKVSVFRFH